MSALYSLHAVALWRNSVKEFQSSLNGSQKAMYFCWIKIFNDDLFVDYKVNRILQVNLEYEYLQPDPSEISFLETSVIMSFWLKYMLCILSENITKNYDDLF